MTLQQRGEPTPASSDADVVAQLRRRERWLLALAAARSVMLSGANLTEAMDLIAERSGTLSEADAVLLLLDDGAGNLRVWAVAGPAAVIDSGPRHGPRLEASTAWTKAMRSVVGVARTSDFPEPDHDGLAEVWREADSLLIAPIPPNNGAGGVVICLRLIGRRPFTADQQPELVGLAEQAAIAMDVAQRQEQLRELELMADRERIARDLHDHVIQRLFAVGLSLQTQIDRTADEAVRGRIDHAVQQIDEAISDLRTSIFDLRATTAGQAGNLRRRLTEIAGEAGDAGPRVAIRYRGAVDTMITAQLAEQVEAVVREGVSNAVRHAGASVITVTVAVTDKVRVTVADDGVGIAPGAARSGLVNLAQRAADCGGTFTAQDSSPGTVLDWVAPLG